MISRGARTPPARALVGLLERVGPSRRTFAVLTYHRVDRMEARPWLYPGLLSATPGEFEEQMKTLLRYYRPLALSELLAAYSGDAEVPPRSVLVTFDDAYRDFSDIAWPVLRRLGIPATLFVPTGFPGQLGRAFWWDRLWQALVEAREPAIDTALGRFDLSGDGLRRQAGRALVEYYKRLPHDAAMRGIHDMCLRLERRPPRSEVLSWDELRTLAVEGVQLGAHSRNHALLTRVPLEVVADELKGCRDDLHANVPEGAYTSVFAYPGGQHDRRTREMVSEQGFKLAFTTERGINRLGETDRFRLRRINVGTRSHADLIRAQIAISTLRHRTIGR